MNIKKIRIENYRSFNDQEISLNKYSCFVGSNGVGKSTVLCALNVFFKEQDSSATDTASLCDEDFFARQTNKPVRITLTFDNLSVAAKTALSDYVRQDELVVTAEANFNAVSGLADVRHFGQRLGMKDFRPYFEAVKAGAKADELNAIFTQLQAKYPGIASGRSKEAKAEALRQYEADHPTDCTLIPSEDNFYGINSTGKLVPFIQWIYVPAVKDARQEGQEAKNTAFGKLIARTVRSRTNFDGELNKLKEETLAKYKELLDKNRNNLDEISCSLQKRLEEWAHPNVRIGMDWQSDPNKSIQVQPPVVALKTGDRDFLGSLARMGHGLQRCYLLALLQELASSDLDDAPTLVLGCEEPELYQHPPQARHLADVFGQLAEGNNQILITTHSPLFVTGDGFENVRLVRTPVDFEGSLVSGLTFSSLCTRIRSAMGEDNERQLTGLIAKIHQTLRPHISEMFFTRVPILVEGLEDSAYITAQLLLSGQWEEFRRLGCYVIPVNGKDKLIKPLAIAKEIGIPVFVVFDADGNTVKPEHRTKHEKDNKALITLLDASASAFPDTDIIGFDFAIWSTNLTKTVAKDIGEKCSEFKDASCVHYAHEGDLEKNELFIADWLSAAYSANVKSSTLTRLCTAILDFAKK